MSQRVLFLSTGLGAGGAARFLLRACRRLTEMGTSCGVVSLTDEGVIGAESLRHSAIPLWCLGLKRATAWPTVVSRLRNVLATLRPTVIQGWMYHGNIAATIAARMTQPVPAVAWGVRRWSTATALDPAMTRIAIRLGAFVSEKADVIIYNSAVARAGHEAAGFSSKNGAILPNGFEVSAEEAISKQFVELRRELHVPPGAPLIGHVARWHPVKDHQTLLAAAAQSYNSAAMRYLP